MTFPDGDQPNLAFTAVRGESFISPTTGRRIWGYLAISAPMAMPVTTISLDDGAIIEFEVGAPPSDAPLPIKLYLVSGKKLRDAIFESTGRGWKSLESGSFPVTDSLADLRSTHREEV